jgi:hypothetical protein
MSERGDADCAFEMRNGVMATLPINQLKGKPPRAVCPILNLHRCKFSGFPVDNSA